MILMVKKRINAYTVMVAKCQKNEKRTTLAIPIKRPALEKVQTKQKKWE